MRKVVVSIGFAAISVAVGGLLFASLFSAGHADRATGILIAAGLFTAAITAVVRK
jgi:hypothetical protein